MVDAVRNTLRERISRGATIDEIDVLIRMSRGLTEHQRASLWTFAWGYTPDVREPQNAPARPLMRAQPQPLH
jgi:hypothetical protein